MQSEFEDCCSFEMNDHNKSIYKNTFARYKYDLLNFYLV